MTRRPRSWRGTTLTVGGACLAALALVAGCGNPETGVTPPREALTGDPQRGAELISSYGCGSCHEVPGVHDANGLVGPPLGTVAERTYIAGMLPNSVPNMEKWIRKPQAVVPGNAMPDLGVSRKDAADITAYLYSLP
jgi:cytochrome c